MILNKLTEAIRRIEAIIAAFSLDTRRQDVPNINSRRNHAIGEQRHASRHCTCVAGTQGGEGNQSSCLLEEHSKVANSKSGLKGRTSGTDKRERESKHGWEDVILFVVPFLAEKPSNSARK